MSRSSPPLVVVHVPKTAGTSLRLALREAYGEGLLEDYGDRPLTHPWWRRRAGAMAAALGRAGRPPGAPCVFGHFLALKYRWCRPARFALWTRDPVDRVLSRYAHYLRDSAAGDGSHAARGLRPGLDLDGFLALPNYRDTLTEYLWGFPLERLDFIGTAECFDEDLGRLSRRFLEGRALPRPVENRSPPALGPDRLDAGIRERVARANARDVALHRRLLALRADQVTRGE